MRLWRASLLVAVQLIALAVIVLTGPLIAHGLWRGVELVGLACLVWAVVTTPPRQWRISPAPATTARLLRHGPYRWIRHPMYAGLLTATLALVASHPHPLRWVMWALLAVVLHAKLKMEEEMLRTIFPDYEEYCRRTKRLIPGVY